MRLVVLALYLALIGTPANAQTARVTSAYTSLDLDRCKPLDQADLASASWRCEGLAGIPLFIQNGDDRYDVDAGRPDNDEFWSDGFDYPGKTVEWRLRRGKPFAIIYRLDSANPESPKWSRLIVESIGRASPGCRVASINGRARDANAQARRAADGILGGSVRCMKK
jgi:hypothetical protein